MVDNSVVYSTDSKEHLDNLDDTKELEELEEVRRLEEFFWEDPHWEDY